MAVIKEKRCYTVQEIQDILNISRPSVYKLLKRGEFHSVFVAGRHRISKASFDAWLNGYEESPNAYETVETKENEPIVRTGLFQEPTEKETPIVSDFSVSNVGTVQRVAKNQERLIPNWLKAYLIIDSRGYMK